MMSLKSTAALAAMVFGCAGLVYAEEKGAGAAKADKPTTTPAATVTTTGPSSEVAVTVNGKAITEGQIEQFVRDRFGGRMPAEQLATVRVQIRPRLLEMLIDLALLEEQAAQERITIDDKDVLAKVEEQMDQIRKQRSMSKEDMVKVIKQQMQMEYKDFLAKRAAELAPDPMLRSQILQVKLLEKLHPDRMKVTDAEVKEYYDKHLDREYKQGAMVRASHILIGTKDMKTDEEKAEAKKQAEKVLEEVKKEGSDFGALAKQYSSCPSKDRGGDLDFFPRNGAMVEPFAAAAFALKTGEISEVVETQFGYHVIKV
ncbi:MAG: peptidylprolyl isomerase, partial [Planctomycetes bacterium]|nr:peptidylprolyl isomerase [Planctomycetota bacterium]